MKNTHALQIHDTNAFEKRKERAMILTLNSTALLVKNLGRIGQQVV